MGKRQSIKCLSNVFGLTQNFLNNYQTTPYANYGNTTIRIHNSVLNKSLIFDPKAGQVIQLGMPNYTW
jgi:hypothetical protein